MRNIFYVGLMILVWMYSCNDYDQSLDEKSTNKVGIVNNLESLYDEDSNLKREFGKALIGAMKQSKALRGLLKTEALKMFDKDYDVLYLLIKDKQLENSSVEELIAKHLGGKQQLNEIISQNPTLTILVPELPNNSFSAKLWDTESMVPAVAIRINKGNGVPIIKTDGTQGVIPAKYIPVFPVLVIKNNERVIASNSSSRNNKRFNQLKTRSVYSGNGLTLKFWDNTFDNSTKHTERKRTITNPSSKLKEAYNIYKYADGWQRDYIYYGITPSNPNGNYKYDYKEHITTFSLAGNPENAISKINDQNSDWTEGSYEFRIITTINSKNGVGEQLINGFVCSKLSIGGLEFSKPSNGLVSSKLTSLNTIPISIPLINWKLEDYSPAIKIYIEEVDLSETYTISETRTVKFATNFSINPTLGFLEKVGLKFGASLAEEQTQTNQISYTKESDFLGEVIVNFADNVIIGKNNSTYTTRVYSTGYCKLGLEPKKVQ